MFQTGFSTEKHISKPLTPILLTFKTLDRVPENEQGEGWLEWFRTCTNAFEMKGYDALAASRHLRVLSKFAVQSSQHREAVMRYLESSQFLNLWKSQMSVLLGAMTEAQLADVLYNLAYLEIFGKRLLSVEFYAQWFIHVSPMNELSAPSLSRMVWAIGILGIRPDDTFKDNFVVAFNREFAGFRSYHLADMIWAFGRVEATEMPQEFFEFYFAAFERERSHFNANDLAVILWGLARLNVCPDELVLSFWMERAVELIDQFTPNDLANIMHAFGKLELHPGDEFLKLWYGKWREVSTELDAQALVDSLWGLARINVKPPKEFMNLFYQGWRRERLFINVGDLRTSIYAFARLNLNPASDFLVHWYDAFKRRLVHRNFEEMQEFQLNYHSVDGTTIATILWSFAKLKLHPTSTFLKNWYALSELFIKYFCAQDLSHTLWAMSKLQIRPTTMFLRQWLNESISKSNQFTLIQHDIILGSFLSLRISPPEVFLIAFIPSMLTRLIEYANEESSFGLITSILYTMARLNIQPSLALHEDWTRLLSAFCLQLRLHMESAKVSQIGTVLWSFAILESRPGKLTIESLLKRFMDLCHAEATAKDLAIVLWSLDALKVEPNEKFRNVWNDAWKREVAFADESLIKMVENVESKSKSRVNI
eukprot:CAMPEP_0182441812 /NCGR_PEP_ID=MMETSP1172-20130603/811_1 /TAXON_ID=708627 /ORGANISM="Timspurckia oligopyrenoides, Strain CCMP3278" /LENGTH=651 /DNA_ID=CAMNT_0024636363 /DNA_START=225 /DNA_END=2180 /DNA_ORIENTATION=+